jgi:uncharacterized protein (TIGR02611 family)
MVAWTLKKAKRVIVAVIGGTVLAFGMAMIVLPGPAIIVIPLGLGILATEFVWARTLLHKAKGYISRRRSWGARQGVGVNAGGT